MAKQYKNLRNRRENDPPGDTRTKLTEIYYLERIESALNNLFWGVVVGIIFLLGIVIKVLVG